MPIGEDEKNLIFANRTKPMVGLIHKVTRDMVFAPCIPQKVSLELNALGLGEAGTYLDENLKVIRAITPTELGIMNTLLSEGHVPRLGWKNILDEKSAHEFLYEQKCKTTKRSEWGGFALTLDAADRFEYQFSSGAFNSPPGHRRVKGAQLSEELQREVLRETAALVGQTISAAAQNPLPPAENESTPADERAYATPPRKRLRPEEVNGATPLEISGFSIFSNLAAEEPVEAEKHREGTLTAVM
jgi:hypothetical protein